MAGNIPIYLDILGSNAGALSNISALKALDDSTAKANASIKTLESSYAKAKAEIETTRSPPALKKMEADLAAIAAEKSKAFASGDVAKLSELSIKKAALE